MPRKPRFVHPVRAIRTCLEHTQVSFAKYIGCSAITIQRIENGTLPVSRRMAYTISEATGADPEQLRAGAKGKPLDMMGNEYSKKSYQFQKTVLPVTPKEIHFLTQKIISYSQLLLIATLRGTQYKTHAVFSEITEAFRTIADDFELKQSIHSFLIENGHVEKRKYRVSDLREFPDFARIIGFKDDKRFKPDKLIEYVRPKGWICDYQLNETAVLPQDVEMKLRPNANYYIDLERPVPKLIQEAMDQALYWQINEFRLNPTDPWQKS